MLPHLPELQAILLECVVLASPHDFVVEEEAKIAQKRIGQIEGQYSQIRNLGSHKSFRDWKNLRKCYNNEEFRGSNFI
jgi:hypothetical protein